MSYKKTENITKELILETFHKEKRIGLTAIELNISVKTLYKLLKKFDIQLEKYPSEKEIDMMNKECNFLTVIERKDHNKYGRTIWKCKCVCGNTALVTGKELRNGDVKSCGCMNKGYGDILPGYLYSGIRRRALLVGHGWDLDYKYLCDLWKKQNGKCALTGRVLIISANKKDYLKKRDTTASLDRIDSLKEYEPGNVQWVHKHVNKLKNNLTMEEFINICKEVIEWHKNAV